jgi:protein MPE1
MRRVDKPTGSAEGLADDMQSGKVMLDADGNHVIVEPDKASWEKFEAKHKAAVAQQEAASSSTVNKELEERGLLCSIDKRLFVDPVKTPCCGKIYCHECIENTLLDSDLVCPNCSQPVLIDDLTTDEEMTEKVREYQREKAVAKSAKSPKSPKEAKDNEKDVEPDGYDDDQKNNEKAIQKPKDVFVRSPSPAKSPANTPETTKSDISTASKKRLAEDDDTDWSNVPKGPAAMRNQQQQRFPTPPQFTNSQFPMMPNFPIQPPFPMQPQFPFNNNYFPPGNMNNMNMMANMTWSPMAPNMPPLAPMGQIPVGGQQLNSNRFQQNNNNQQDDSAYMRQPVNPRHQHRTKRARPCDYTTLS